MQNADKNDSGVLARVRAIFCGKEIHPGSLEKLL